MTGSNPGEEAGEEGSLSVDSLREEFGMDPDNPPCSIHENDDGQPYWFAGNSYAAQKSVREKLEGAGYTWEHPRDGRFDENKDKRTFIITGRRGEGE